MDISFKNIDELNATLKIKYGKEDYEERVSKVLKDYRKKANVPGFRPGMVPMGLINKMYGKAVLADELNKMVSNQINEYIKTNELHVLGDPLPSETESKTLDLDNETEFEFAFDLGLAPKFEASVNDKDKITAYSIKVDDKMLNSYLDSYTRRYGKFVTCNEITENEMLKGRLLEVNEQGEIVPEGIQAGEVSLYLEICKDDAEKKKFVGKKAGNSVVFDIKKAFPNDTEIAGLLKIEKDQVAGVTSNFMMEIETVSKFENAELNAELFDKVYGEGTVTTTEEFKEKVADEIKSQLAKDEEYKFNIDAKAHMLKKLNITLPSAFLKRWIIFMNEGKLSAEQIEKEFGHFEEDMKWQLIKNKIAKENNIEINENEVVEEAKESVRMQFRQYGINNLPDEHLQSMAVNTLKQEKEVNKLVERLMEKKVAAFIREKATIKVKEVSNEEFGKLFE